MRGMLQGMTEMFRNTTDKLHGMHPGELEMHPLAQILHRLPHKMHAASGRMTGLDRNIHLPGHGIVPQGQQMHGAGLSLSPPGATQTAGKRQMTNPGAETTRNCNSQPEQLSVTHASIWLLDFESRRNFPVTVCLLAFRLRFLCERFGVLCGCCARASQTADGGAENHHTCEGRPCGSG